MTYSIILCKYNLIKELDPNFDKYPERDWLFMYMTLI